MTSQEMLRAQCFLTLHISDRRIILHISDRKNYSAHKRHRIILHRELFLAENYSSQRIIPHRELFHTQNYSTHRIILHIELFLTQATERIILHISDRMYAFPSKQLFSHVSLSSFLPKYQLRWDLASLHSIVIVIYLAINQNTTQMVKL